MSLITDEIVAVAIKAGTPKPTATYDPVFQEFDMRAALEAAFPAIRRAVLEEAAKAGEDCAITADNDLDEAFMNGVVTVVAAIRALAEKP